MFGDGSRPDQAEPGARLFDAKVTWQKRVRVAERAHHDVARRPITDPWQFAEFPIDLHPVRSGVQRQVAGGNGLRQSTQCRPTGRRDA